MIAVKPRARRAESITQAEVDVHHWLARLAVSLSILAEELVLLDQKLDDHLRGRIEKMENLGYKIRNKPTMTTQTKTKQTKVFNQTKPPSPSSCVSAEKISCNYKGELQEREQKALVEAPRYITTIEGEGFRATVVLQKVECTGGLFKRKKDAEQDAARLALSQ